MLGRLLQLLPAALPALTQLKLVMHGVRWVGALPSCTHVPRVPLPPLPCPLPPPPCRGTASLDEGTCTPLAALTGLTRLTLSS